MKKVILKRLTMQNFRGEQNRTTEFKETETTICGQNGLGKSRHFDATIWLLFGKDAQDRKDYEIKTRVDGQELHNVDTSVEGVFYVDDEILTLKRVLVEDWVKPRGTTDRVFNGNKTECWWNGTPVPVTEYNKRVNEIIDATLFKMLTNPSFFVNMKWQDQREQLMQIAGKGNDITTEHPEFAEFIEQLSGKSLTDFHKELAAERKRLKSELDEIQPRIDQTTKMMPERINVSDVNECIKILDAKIDDIEKQMVNVAEKTNAVYKKSQEYAERIGQIKLREQEIIMNAKSVESERVFAANEKRRQIEQDLRTANADLSRINIELSQEKSARDIVEREIDEYTKKNDEIRNEWFAVNNEVFNNDGVCPNCGQAFPQEMLDKAFEIFNTNKANRLEELKAKGVSNKKHIDDLKNETLVEMDERRVGIEKKRDEINERIAELNKTLSETPVEKQREIEPSEIGDWRDCEAEMHALQAAMDALKTPNDGGNEKLTEEKRALVAERDEQRKLLSVSFERERMEKEIERLENDGRDLAQQIADIEQKEFTAEQVIRTNVEDCERRINAMFTMVKFRMFDYTQDGNAFETCIPMVNGVYFGSANTAGQMNAGLDIINALVRQYEISAPIFIDGRESVNELLHTESQIINLVVTDDDHLIVK